MRRKIMYWLERSRATIAEAARKSWKGAATGALVTLSFFLLVSLVYIRIGISPVVDWVIGLVAIAALVGLAVCLTSWGFRVVRQFNPWFVGACAAAYLFLGLLSNAETNRMLVGLELVCGGLIGYALVTGIRKKVSIALLTIVLGVNGYLVYFLVSDHSASVPVTDTYWNQKVTPLAIANPSDRGEYTVKTLFYGSGNDKHRPEYGASCDLMTDPVDATPFFDQTSGFNNWIRKQFWGFDSSCYPINGRVWYPEGEGPFPLVVFVHGNHNMDDYSDPGYEYVASLLASRGYIVASIDENFLNGSWSGDYGHGEIFTRAWVLLKHLENWRAWNQRDDNPFYGLVDMDNIALVGHSRGGQAVPLATVINKQKNYYGDANQHFDFNFSIKGIVEIGPTHYYSMTKDKPLEIENVDYLLLQGGYDQDMYFMGGLRKYNNLRFTDTDFHFKSLLYVYTANHGQFNTAWGRKDVMFPQSLLLNLKPLMGGDEQREIAKTYISAFLDASLKGKKEYLPMLKDYRTVKEMLPRDYYINQYEDTSFKYIADYEEDLDVTTASMKGCVIAGENLKTWKEDAIVLRDNANTPQLTSAVYLGWERSDTIPPLIPLYTIRLDSAASLALEADSVKSLFFFIGNNSDTAQVVDFTIELAFDSVSVRKDFSSFYILPPVLKQELSKCDGLLSLGREGATDKVLQYIEIPLSAFGKEGESFPVSGLRQIRFIFDRTAKGNIIVDRIGME